MEDKELGLEEDLEEYINSVRRYNRALTLY
jgi:hypothetical protein